MPRRFSGHDLADGARSLPAAAVANLGGRFVVTDTPSKESAKASSSCVILPRRETTVVCLDFSCFVVHRVVALPAFCVVTGSFCVNALGHVICAETADVRFSL